MAPRSTLPARAVDADRPDVLRAVRHGALMGCNCGRTASGAAIVYQYHEPGKTPRTFSTKTEAEVARTRAGGKGPIIRTTQPNR